MASLTADNAVGWKFRQGGLPEYNPDSTLAYIDEFDIITAIQVYHYLRSDERKIALQKCYEALKDNGLFINFENFAPFTNLGKSVYLEKWKR